MIMLRDYFLNTDKGVNVKFLKDEPVGVHPLAIESALAVGAVFADGGLYNPTPKEKKTEEKYGFEREQDIHEASKRLMDRSNADDFTSGGVPKLKAIEAEVGYPVDRKEADAVWRKVLESRANEL